MIEQLRKNAGYWIVALGMILAGLAGGCQSGTSQLQPEHGGNTLHIGDSVMVSGLTPSGDPNNFTAVNLTIHEDGTITLPLIGSVPAADKTAGELQKTIHDLYVPRYYPELTVIVRGEASFIYVEGEVRAPGKVEYPGAMTIVKAITSVGGFTDFANERSVRLTRGKHSQIVNVARAIKDPNYDVPVYPGDKIHVKRRIF